MFIYRWGKQVRKFCQKYFGYFLGILGFVSGILEFISGSGTSFLGFYLKVSNFLTCLPLGRIEVQGLNLAYLSRFSGL